MNTPTPVNGVDRCECGCKYWVTHWSGPCGCTITHYTCFVCEARFDPRDVHTEHCCTTHGCRYGGGDCTIISGEKPQSFPCEFCEFEREQRTNYLASAPDDDIITEVYRRGLQHQICS